MFLIRFGGDLLSHVLRRSTIGATALNGRVRDGIGCFARAMTTKPNKEHKHHSEDAHGAPHNPCHLHICVAFEVQLLLDQIKPIEQLVPVN